VDGAKANELPDPVNEDGQAGAPGALHGTPGGDQRRATGAKVGSVQQVLVDAIDGELRARSRSRDGLVQIQAAMRRRSTARSVRAGRSGRADD
jgi:ribosomal protein S12 methylthiotransferase